MNETIDSIHLKRGAGLRGEVYLPGSKSIANRALLLSAISRGTTSLFNLPGSDDVRILLEALPGLGLHVDGENYPLRPGLAQTHPVRITGAGGPFSVPSASVYLENAGTAVRPMTAVLAAGNGNYRVDGNEQMQKRPIGDLVDALRMQGVEVDCPTGSVPVSMKTTGLRGGKVEISGAVSSQFLSALLMAAPLGTGPDFEIRVKDHLVSTPYIEITLKVMEEFGVQVDRIDERSYAVKRTVYESPGSYMVEGDASAATYFLAGGSLPGAGPVTVHGIGESSIQGDANFTNLLEQMGATITRTKRSITARGPEAGRTLRAIDVDMNAMPDAAMTLAVLALFAEGQTRIRNIANLRVKESERIQGLHSELVKLGAGVEELEDALFISPPQNGARFAKIETFKDHRMAMAFSLASFATDIEILDPACVSKTYPGYFDDFIPLVMEPK